MLDRISATAWFAPQEPADCSVRREAQALLPREATAIAGELALATLASHQLVHRLRHLPQPEVAKQPGMPPAPSVGSDPGALLRVVPLPAVVIDGEGSFFIELPLWTGEG
jgi:hypothetical protein